MEYDKFSHNRHGRDATRKLLLSPTHNSHHGGDRLGSSNGASTAMFQPPRTDIYLCDKCENEFYSLREVQAHERKCCGETPPSPGVPSPEPEPVEEDPQPDDQVPFLAYFKLRPAEHTGLTPYTSPRKTSFSPPRRILGPLYPRYETVPLSSPLGKYLFTNSKFRNKYQVTQHSVMRYERHLPATPNTEVNFKERCHNRWLVVWRGRKEQQSWVHLYCFNRVQRRDRLLTINTGLDLHSRRLLRLCRPVTVKLKRLQKRLVDRLQRLGGPAAPCIDLTEEAQLDPSLAYSTNSLPIDPLQRVNWGGCGTKAASLTPTGELQWVTGLPQVSTDTYLPGASGIIPPAAQLALPQPIPGQETPLGTAPLANPDSRHPFHPSLVQNISMGHYSSKTVCSADGTSLYAKPCTSLSADISLIPLNAINSTSNIQSTSDVMKPLSRKRFAINDPHLVFNQKSGSSDQKRVEFRTNMSNTVTVTPRYESPGHNPTPSASCNSTKSGLDMYSHLIPQWNANPTTIGNSVTLSDLTQSKMNSSIEVIDLSSDEDDLGRGRSRNEADNAPQQLDGLACYPHTGAKVPNSSQYSSKNGNSHWSSEQKSHCGTGRGGDLATNGLPPNVLPSVENSPISNSSFFPTLTVPPTLMQGPETKANSRKRKRESDSGLMSPQGGKTLILDISKQGVKVSQAQVSPISTQPEQDYCIALSKNDPSTYVSAEILPTTPKDISNMYSYLDMETSHLRASEAIGAFENPKNAYESSKMFIVDEDSSCKAPLQVDKDISLCNFPQSTISEGLCNFKSTEKQIRSCAQDNLPSDNTHASGILSNIYNTVSKGVKFFKSLVNPKNSSDARCITFDALTHKEYNADLNIQRSHQSFKVREDSAHKRTRDTKNISVYRKNSEVNRLLRDECRELRLNGLMDLRDLDVENVKVTRKSVEMFMPKSNQKSLSHRLKHRKADISKIDDRSMLFHKDRCSGCMDENGNSASSLTVSLDRQNVENGQNGTFKRKASSVLSENNRASSDSADRASSGSVDTAKEITKVNNGKNVQGKPLIAYSDTALKSAVFNGRSKGNETFENINSKDNNNEIDTNNINGSLNTHTHCSNMKGKCDVELLQQYQCAKVGRVQETSDKNSLYCYEFSSQHYNYNEPKENAGRRKYFLSQLLLCPVGNIPNRHEIKNYANMREVDTRMELTGETAEECGAWQAQFPPSHSSLFSASNTSPVSKNTKHLLLNYVKRSPVSIAMTKSKLTSPQVIKISRKPKRKHLSRELSNLAADEWKEIKESGYHPSDLVGTEKVMYFNTSSDEEDLSSCPPYPQTSHQPYSSENSKRSLGNGNLNKEVPMKLSREVALLLKDECKELKRSRQKLPRARAHLKREANQPNRMRSITIGPNRDGLETNVGCQRQSIDGSLGKVWPSRSTRSQANTVPNADTPTPRNSHRQILQTETAMCVLNFKLPNII
ncbi:hypothetical protein Pcinc_030308 [Petrolisthes cinctipes]|uniref:C2H2-type domain-containing protein n=1 Tax=Petrolisthes cinctipes TaxID=88211 RepID=A0AAE1EZ07_PETCI|nr:hypothetical protein Pcinc_030308 [Petrolisthes cinctipes]